MPYTLTIQHKEDLSNNEVLQKRMFWLIKQVVKEKMDQLPPKRVDEKKQRDFAVSIRLQIFVPSEYASYLSFILANITTLADEDSVVAIGNNELIIDATASKIRPQTLLTLIRDNFKYLAGVVAGDETISV